MTLNLGTLLTPTYTYTYPPLTPTPHILINSLLIFLFYPIASLPPSL